MPIENNKFVLSDINIIHNILDEIMKTYRDNLNNKLYLDSIEETVELHKEYEQYAMNAFIKQLQNLYNSRLFKEAEIKLMEE